VLAPLRALIEALAASPIATAFYSYSSLNRLCFSASSHYPWVHDGLPVITQTGDGDYLVDETRCDLAQALVLVERTLAAYPVRPFFGSAPDHELPRLIELFESQESALRPRVEQSGAWYRLVVANGLRQCEVRDRHVMFTQATRRFDLAYPSLDDAVSGIRRYLQDDSSVDEFAAEEKARVSKVSRPGAH
jgi:hypothetical protein